MVLQTQELRVRPVQNVEALVVQGTWRRAKPIKSLGETMRKGM